MSIYNVEEMSFEVPEGYTDRTLNMFYPASQGGGAMSITVAREARTDEALPVQVGKFLKAFEKFMQSCKVVGQRETVVGNLGAREVKVHGTQNKQPIYQRQAHVSWFGTMLTFFVTSPRGSAQKCDAVADAILASVRFRKP